MNISVTKGQSALFKCTVSREDDIEIDIKWKFNDVFLDFSSGVNTNPNLRSFSNGTLQILEAKNTDIGTYKCIVSSVSNPSAGNDSKIAYLNVVELPYSPGNLFATLYNLEKRTVNLTWSPAFDGNSPIIKYIIQARILSLESNLQQSFEQHQQQQPIISHEWFVIKDNIYETVSGAMANQQNYYTMYYQQQQTEQQQTHWTLIGDLRPAVCYEFRISAVNGIGEGMPSMSSNNITIPEEVPGAAPRNIQAFPVSSKMILVQWVAPVASAWNGRLKGYQIAYSLSYPNSTWKFLQVDDASATTANISDLIVWEIYLIKLCAYNTKGFGMFSEPLRVRTKEGIPIKPPNGFIANAVNSTCIKMSWSAPPPQFVNGLIQGYKLIVLENNVAERKQVHVIDTNGNQQYLFEPNQYASSASHTHVSLDNQFESLSKNQFSYQICNLAKYTMYSLSILCFTSSGDGPTTQPVQLQTLEDIPGEVSDISFPNVYDTSLEITWSPPIQPNGRILSYVISYRPLLLTTTTATNHRHQQQLQTNRSSSSAFAANQSSSTLVAVDNEPKFEHIVLDSSQTNYTLRNLRASSDYIIGIRAKTQAGDGLQKLTQIRSGVPPEVNNTFFY